MRIFVRPILLVVACAGLASCGPSAGAKRAQSLLDRGDYQGAAQVATGELGTTPTDGDLQRIRIQAALELGDASGAVAHYRAWSESRDGEDLAALRIMALTTLAQGLTSQSALVQMLAIRAVERHEIERLARSVAKQMDSGDDRIAATAAVAVLRSFPQAPDVATQMLTSGDPQARAIAVEGIGRKIGKLAIQDLRRAAADADPRVRAVAVAALGAIADPADNARLTELATDRSSEVRVAALRALSRGQRGDLTTVASHALTDQSLGVRLAAVDLLVSSRGKSAANELLGHSDAMVAAYAGRATGDRVAATPPIDRALADVDPSVRAGAVNLLGAALAKEPARSRATAATKDPIATVRMAGARALAYLGDRTAASAVYADIIATAGELDQIAAAAELAHIGDPRGTALLIQLGASSDPDVRAQVVAAHRTARVITQGLWSALADDRAATRVEAAAILVALGAG